MVDAGIPHEQKPPKEGVGIMRFGRLVKGEHSHYLPVPPGVLASLDEKETDTPSDGLDLRTSSVLNECSKAMHSWNRHPGCPTLLTSGRQALL